MDATYRTPTAATRPLDILAAIWSEREEDITAWLTRSSGDAARGRQAAAQVLRETRGKLATGKYQTRREIIGLLYRTATWASRRHVRARLTGKNTGASIPPEQASAVITVAWEQHHVEVVRYVQTRIYDEQLAWDVVAEVFLKAQQVLERGDGRADEPIVKLLFHTAKLVLQSTTVSERRYQDLPDWDEAGDRWVGMTERRAEFNPERAAERHETVRAVRAALATLPETTREIAVMHFGEQRTPAQIGASLGLPAHVCTRHIKSAQVHLRSLLTAVTEAA
jgi:RNA polymerase sigma factor (sigma-70 family)